MVKSKEKRERRNRIFLGIIMVFLMITSGFGVYLSAHNRQGTITYKGIKFERTDRNYFVAEIQGKKIAFFNLPNTLDDITINPDVISEIWNAPQLTLSFPPEENPLIINQLTSDFYNAFNKPLQQAVTKETLLYDVPVMTCKNASEENTVVLIKNDNATSITLNNHCVILHGSGGRLLRLRDKLLYTYYGVI